MKRRLLYIIPVAIALIVGVAFGARYLAGSWAPTSFQGGLGFSELPEVIDSQDNELSDQAAKEFAEICGRLRTTTRSIGEDQGDGFVRLRFPTTKETDFLTIYSAMGIIFHGRWIDAKTYQRMGRRAPCFELSDELTRFIDTHDLKSTNAEQAGGDQPATRGRVDA